MGRNAPRRPRAHLAAVERLYQAVIQQTGADTLDTIINALDFEGIEAALGSLLAQLRNDSVIRDVNNDDAWKSAQWFIDDILSHLSHAASDRISEMSSNFLRLTKLYRQVAVTREKPPAPIRALPSMVVEELYKLFDPTSDRNPFRTETLRYRNFLIFLMLLHLGLRRGELLILPAKLPSTDIQGEPLICPGRVAEPHCLNS